MGRHRQNPEDLEAVVGAVEVLSIAELDPLDMPQVADTWLRYLSDMNGFAPEENIGLARESLEGAMQKLQDLGQHLEALDNAARTHD